MISKVFDFIIMMIIAIICYYLIRFNMYIPTVLFLCGVLICGSMFSAKEIKDEEDEPINNESDGNNHK